MPRPAGLRQLVHLVLPPQHLPLRVLPPQISFAASTASPREFRFLVLAEVAEAEAPPLPLRQLPVQRPPLLPHRSLLLQRHSLR